MPTSFYFFMSVGGALLILVAAVKYVRVEEQTLSKEVLQTYFEFFKHLNTATIIAILAIYRASSLPIFVISPIVMIGLSLGVSVAGMNTVVDYMRDIERTSLRRLIAWQRASSALFLFGLATFATLIFDLVAPL